MRDVPPSVLKEQRKISAIHLKEVLDRIPLPPFEEIPDAEAMRSQKRDQWSVPGTEIVIALVTEGPRKGQYLFSPDTVARISSFFEEVRHLPYRPDSGGGTFEEVFRFSDSILPMRWITALPDAAHAEYLGHEVWQWVGLLVSFAVAVLIPVLIWLWGRRHFNVPQHERIGGFRTNLGRYLFPISLIGMSYLADFVISKGFQIHGDVLIETKLVLTAIIYLGFAWLAAALMNDITAYAVKKAEARRERVDVHVLKLGLRFLNVLIIIAIGVDAAQELGIPLAAVVTGLGVGGIAVALAAQSTVENLIGGIALVADKPVQVGDFCRFGETVGTVEEIGLRSIRIRTLDRTVVSVPNGDFSKLQLENFARRDEILFKSVLELKRETSPDQLSRILETLRELLTADPRVAEEPFRVRLVGFGQYSLDIEIFSYITTANRDEFLAIREELLLRIMDIVEQAGTALAMPVRVNIQPEADETLAEFPTRDR